jgi:hypothetical protein
VYFLTRHIASKTGPKFSSFFGLENNDVMAAIVKVSKRRGGLWGFLRESPPGPGS